MSSGMIEWERDRHDREMAALAEQQQARLAARRDGSDPPDGDQDEATGPTAATEADDPH